MNDYSNINFREKSNEWQVFLRIYTDSYKILDGYNFEKSIMPTFMNKIGFYACNLRGTSFENSSDFYGAGFRECNMTGVNLKGAEIDKGFIKNCDCTDMNFEGGKFWRENDLTGTNFTNANFTKSFLCLVEFQNNILKNTNFQGCRFDTLYFGPNIDFTGTNFANATGKEINIKSLDNVWNLSKAKWDGVQVETIKGGTIGGLIIVWKGASVGTIKYNDPFQRKLYSTKNVILDQFFKF